MRRAKLLKKLLLIVLAVDLALYPSAIAAKNIPGFYGSTSNLVAPVVDALPRVQSIVQGVSSIEEVAGNKLIVHQDEKRAIVDWRSFDIGAEAWTHFDQKGNTDWAALNRIYDANPSQIFGQLTADGKIYLINQNGILFGAGSQVNTHSIAASALQMTNEGFLDGTLAFQYGEYDPETDKITASVSGDSVVANYGKIVAAEGGMVLLIASQVENNGTIQATNGYVGLIAGQSAQIETDEGTLLKDVTVGTPGPVTNYEDGVIASDYGQVGLYGSVVQQEGIIRSISAVNNEGVIELRASEKIVTGVNSITGSPVSSDSDEYHESFEFDGGEITLTGLSGAATGKIEHKGTLYAPSGTVTLYADQRVLLDDDSLIDVSGNWVIKDASDSVVSLELNSVELKNDQGQQDGSLEGETVVVSRLLGTAIGDVSGLLGSDEMTSLENSTTGGDIDIQVADGNIIVKSGAYIDISGGGYEYTQGVADTTLLLAGQNVYSISNASQYLSYDAILGYSQTVYSRFGITETITGLGYGGVNAIAQYQCDYTEGHDAGTLTLIAKTIVFDGSLLASATTGEYQTEYTETEEEYGDYTYVTEEGRRMPRGGILTIGDSTTLTRDYVVDEVRIVESTSPLPDSFGIDDSLADVADGSGELAFVSSYTGVDSGESPTLSYLSAESLSAAGLSNIEIYTNTKLTVDEDAVVELSPGGLRVDDSVEYNEGQALKYVDTSASLFYVAARAIEYNGGLINPTGVTYFNITETATSTTDTQNDDVDKVDMENRVYFGSNSNINLSGETIDNRVLDADDATIQIGHTDGGSLTVVDDTTSGTDVIVKSGAVIDVSGGYEITQDSELLAGTAGSISLEGASIVLDGTLMGYALSGTSGGDIRLHATSVTVTVDTPSALASDFTFDSDLSDYLLSMGVRSLDRDGLLVLGQDQLVQSGFTGIDLLSFDSIDLEEGLNLTVSKTKLASPILDDASDVNTYGLLDYQLAAETSVYMIGGRQVVDVASSLVGDSHISLATTQEVYASQQLPVTYEEGTYYVYLSEDSTITVAPGGSISLSGVDLHLGGTLDAAGGSVTLSSIYYDLTLEESSRILAAGINLPDETSAIEGGEQEYTALAGGDVTLKASYGSLIVESGAVIDISGADPITEYQSGIDGILTETATAASAGSLSLIFRDDLTLDGDIDATSTLSSVSGGTLLVNKAVESEFLTMTQADINRIVASGFDALTYESSSGIDFSDFVTVQMDLSLTLDAPLISSEGNQDIQLSAPWLSVGNSYSEYDSVIEDSETLSELGSQIILSADWLDAFGSVAFSGFDTVSLMATYDISLSDEQYEGSSAKVIYLGQLRTAGDLMLQAARIYPQTSCDFTLRSDEGTLTILPGETTLDSPIVSATGTLALEADYIVQQGYLAAPTGQIAMGREVSVEVDDAGWHYLVVDEAATAITLGSGSVTSTECEVAVAFGKSDGETWRMPDKPVELSSEQSFDDLPEVSEAPSSAILINADDVNMNDDALVGLSAGGSIFSYVFMPGTEGTVDALSDGDCYVIVPGISLPGPSITIGSGGDIPAGTYSILPESYAFLPGAYILEKTGEASVVSGGYSMVANYYTTVTGYETVSGGFTTDAQRYVYTLISASEALSQGTYQITEILNGVPGALTVSGDDVTLNGTIAMQALNAFQGGEITIDAIDIIIGTNLSAPDDDWSGLLLDPDLFDGLDIDTLTIGNAEHTQTVTVSDGTSLAASTVALAAIGDIVLASGAEIHGVDDTTSLDYLNLQYTYDAQYGVNGFRVGELTTNPDTGLWIGTIVYGEANAGNAIGFIANDEKVVLTSDDSDLLIDEVSANIASPYGLTQFESDEGDIVINDNSIIHATDEIGFDGQILLLGGEFYSDHSKLSLSGDVIYFVPEDYTGQRTGGLYITESIWESIQSFDDIALASDESLNFLGDFDLTVSDMLTIDAARITATEPAAYEDHIDGYDGLADVAINAQTLYLLNSDAAYSGNSRVVFLDSTGGRVSYTLTDTASIEINASDVLTIGQGDILFDGFASIDLVAANDIILRGDGTLKSAWSAGSGGTLTVKATRLTTSYYTETDGNYTAADYTLDAGSGAIQVLSSSESTESVGLDYIGGGKITLSAGRIENYGVIENFAGTVNLETGGDGSVGIFLASGSSILARGGVVGLELAGETEHAFYGGGSVSLASDNGEVQVEDGALVDVSNSVYTLIDSDGNASQLDLSRFLETLDADDLVSMVSSGSLTVSQFSGGSVNISAPESGVQLDGDILAHDNGGLSVSGWQDAMEDNIEDAADAASETEWLALLNDYFGDFVYEVVDDTLQVSGVGGSFSLYTDVVDDFVSLNELLQNGGFNDEITIATAGTDTDSGDIDIGAVTISANYLKLLTEKGSVALNGSVVDLSSNLGGGTMTIIAGQDITIDASSIDASSESDHSTGGEVFISAAEGTISLTDTTVDISGNGDTTDGGSVTFRAGTDGDLSTGMRLVLDQTTIIGASKVTARAYDTITYTSDLALDTVLEKATDIMDGAADSEAQLLAYLNLIGETQNGSWGELGESEKETLFHFAPDVEVHSDGDITVAEDWDLSAERFGDQDEAGYLTLQAAGNLHIEADITDTPTQSESGYSDSWSINLIAGNDLDSPDLIATGESGGHLFIGEYAYDKDEDEWELQESGNNQVNARVYTDFGNIQFASSGSTYIGGEYLGYFLLNDDVEYDYDKYQMGFNLGTYSGAIVGFVGNDMVFAKNDGGAIQSAVGDITLSIKGDLRGFYSGDGAGIRTTGEVPVELLVEYYGGIWATKITYTELNFAEADNGGSISITTGGSIYSYTAQNGVKVVDIGVGETALENWATETATIIVDDTVVVDEEGETNWTEGKELYTAIYESSNNTSTTGGIVTMGGGDIDIETDGSFNSSVGTFREGDLTICAGDDISGHFLIADGIGNFISMADIQSTSSSYNLSIELLDASVSLFAMGSVDMGTVFNPTLASGSSISDSWNLTYGMDSAFSVQTVTGDVTLSGSFIDRWSSATYRLLPPSVTISSSGDILIQGSYVITPSAYGNLRLISGGLISGAYEDSSGSQNRAQLLMADFDPELVFGRQDDEMSMTILSGSPKSSTNHSSTLIHLGDDDPVEIKAADDIEEIRIIANKKTEIYAGDDIVGLYYFGQNISPDDLSYIIAGGDIILDSSIDTMSSVSDPKISRTGLICNGPGDFLIQAGDSIYLGITQGIQMTGSLYNTYLDDSGSDLYVLSGINEQFSSDVIDYFFEEIKAGVEAYSRYLAEGDTESANDVVQAIREDVIQSILENATEYEGDIYMTNSQISSQSEQGSIHIIAGGDINVGKTVIPDPDEAGGLAANTGIYTSRGGAIDFFASGDVNINESRLMTFYGGDITGWSDYGDINAGRGSKTAINVNPPKVVWEDEDEDGIRDADELSIEWQPPSVGSGIRAVTYDPDGSQGEEEAPPAGDIYLAAPSGTIDAGEAGIAGNNIYLAAIEVVNVQNIEVSGTSVGVPDTSASATSIGSMVGSGMVSETSNITGEQAGLTDTEERFSKKLAELAENLVPKWLAVEVIGFGDQNDSDDQDMEEEDRM